jgi:[histone H3]-lysine36 N-trimethyltransferase
MRQYDDEGVKHFYFMSLNKGEFVDATKKGNLGRFCNHSCRPNSYVDKWVVGDKLCMGIFAGRDIAAGEELVFNYNVDRYGANPQPCYCGEPNCTGFIGGKTQTEKATKLSDATIEALGIEDGDSWDSAVAKKPKKAKKTGEDDEEYVNKIQPKSLEEDGVTNLMATLMQCKEKWIAVKLLSRIQRADDQKVIFRIVRMHGYRTLKITLNEFTDDPNVCLQVLDILFKFPRLSRNKIESSGIEETIQKLKKSEDERVSAQAEEILQEWSKLNMEYRIPRMKRDPNLPPEPAQDKRKERRARSRSRSRSRSKSPLVAPSGPRSNMPQRTAPFFAGPRPPFRRPPPPPNQLPPGWFSAVDDAGKTYYYSAAGATQWTRPTEAASQPPPPPKILSNEERLQQIINDCIKTSTPTADASASATPKLEEEEIPKKKEDKWRLYPIEKQKKIYETTVSFAN